MIIDEKEKNMDVRSASAVASTRFRDLRLRLKSSIQASGLEDVIIEKDPELVRSGNGVFEFSARLVERVRGESNIKSKNFEYKLIVKKVAENVWECEVTSK